MLEPGSVSGVPTVPRAAGWQFPLYACLHQQPSLLAPPTAAMKGRKRDARLRHLQTHLRCCMWVSLMNVVRMPLLPHRLGCHLAGQLGVLRLFHSMIQDHRVMRRTMSAAFSQARMTTLAVTLMIRESSICRRGSNRWSSCALRRPRTFLLVLHCWCLCLKGDAVTHDRIAYPTHSCMWLAWQVVIPDRVQIEMHLSLIAPPFMLLGHTCSYVIVHSS